MTHNPDGVITHLEPDTLEYKVKWVLGSITMNKASGGNWIPVELFQILKDDAMKVLHSICQQIWKARSGHKTGKVQFSFHSQRKAMQRMLKLPHNCIYLTCYQSNAQNSSNQASKVHELKTSRCSSCILKMQRNRDQIAKILDHRKSKRVPENHLLLLYWLCQSFWLCGSWQTVENL